MLQRRYVSESLIASIAFDAALLFVVIISHVILFRFWVKWFLFLPRSPLLGNTHNSICWLFSRSSSSLRLRLFAFRKLWLDLPRSPASLRFGWWCAFRKFWSNLSWSSSFFLEPSRALASLVDLFSSARSVVQILLASLFFGFRGRPGPFFTTTSSS